MAKGGAKGGKTASAKKHDKLQREKARHPQQVKEVLVDGLMYDVTSFKHPGGSIMNFCDGEDASQAWHEFHSRSKVAAKWLKNLPSRPATAADPKPSSGVVKDFQRLRAELEKEGFFKPSPLHVFYRLSEIVLMHAIGIWLLYHDMPAVGLVVLAIVQGRCGWLMHEGGHYSLTGNISIDRSLQVLLYGVGCGMSASFWRNQHNKHHATPQRLKHDVDLDTLPLVAFTTAVVKPGKSSLWLKLQAFLFLPVSTLLVALGWQFFLHPRHSFRTKNVPEIVALFFRIVCVGSVLAPFGFSTGLLYYLIYDWIGAMYIFGNFSVSHTHLPVTAEAVNWVRYSSDYTINITPSWLCNWWMGYLNFQIEHHLFPSMPQFRHSQISPRVREMFEKNGLTYDVRDYFAALKDTLANLHEVGMEAGLD